MRKDIRNINFENYEYCYDKEVSECEGIGVVLRHKKSGARICLVSCDDENKVFFIAFRTTPTDSTGVAHIIEHTVLCGSEKYPLKDPFIELAKGSLNTFLNALTFPDKTMYPIASCNDKDFQNLMGVYVDAVFKPNIYKHEEIFKQEGWHYELESPDGDVEINGVVYNEMIGAFTSEEDSLAENIKTRLYPDTTYAYCSGGDPDDIPNLTYEQYLDFHRNYYHPSNSYIYLYGNMDMEEKLKWLDEEYLSKYDAIEIDTKVEKQPRFAAPKTVVKTYPVAEGEDTKEKTYLSFSVMLNDYDEIKDSIAYSILAGVLFGQQGAPVKQALIDAGIGSDVSGYYDPELRQANLQIVASQAEESQADEFVRIIEDTLRGIIETGVDKKALESAIAASEFSYREADTGRTPVGLVDGLNMMRTWLHDDNAAFATCSRAHYYEELKEDLNTDYFEGLVRNILEETHRVVMIYKPEPGLWAKKEQALAEKLAAYKASLSADAVEALIKDTEKLRLWQEEGESPEALATLPSLAVADVKKEAEKYANEVRDIDGYTVVFHDLPTRGIVYSGLYFDMNELPRGLWVYASILQSFLGSMNTGNHNYFELNNDVMLYSAGSLNEGMIGKTTLHEGRPFKSYLTYTFKALRENVGKTLDLLYEIISSSDFTDKKRMKEMLAEMVNSERMSLIEGGSTTAIKRAKSYFSKADVFYEETDGITFYRTIKDLLENFDEKADDLIAKMQYVLERIVRSDNMLISVSCRDHEYDIFTEEIKRFVERLKENDSHKKERTYGVVKSVPEVYGPLNEAFTINGGINYCALVAEFDEEDYNISAAASVLKTMLSYDYLWQNVRVKGGAYGCFFDYNRVDGSCGFVSYRDPNLSETYDVYRKAYASVMNSEIDQKLVDKYIIGTMSVQDTPMNPSAKGSVSIIAYLLGQSNEMKQKRRDEILSATPESIKESAVILKRLADSGYICTVGNESTINDAADMFGSITSLV